MTKRESRVVHAFLHCIEHGEFSVDYAITVLEDNQRYGWMSADAKEAFYAGVESIREKILEQTMQDEGAESADPSVNETVFEDTAVSESAQAVDSGEDTSE